MPMLRIQVPGEAAREVPVEGEVYVGRDEGCAVQLAEKKASRRHLRITREGDAWVAEDLDSSNGTYVGEARVLRRVLADGTLLRIGDSELRWSDPAAAAPAPVVGGRLNVVAVGSPAAPEEASLPPASVAPAPEPAVAPPLEEAAVAVAERDPGTRPLDMRSFGRGLAVLVVALVAWMGVQHLLGAKAEQAGAEAQARRDLERLLRDSVSDPRVFEAEARHWLVTNPTSPDRALLERHLASTAERTRTRQAVEARFDSLLSRMGALPEDQVRIGLLALKRDLADDAGLAERVRLALGELDRRRASLERSEAERVRAEARDLVARGLPGPALFRLVSWRAGRGLLSPEEAERMAAAETETLAAVTRLAAETRTRAEGEPDVARRRQLLAAAWPALAGTLEQEPLADQLRFLSRPPRATPGGGTGSTPAGSAAPGAAPGTGTAPEPVLDAAALALLARAREAEKSFAENRWTQARAAFDALAGSAAPGPLKAEWDARRADLDRVLSLVDAVSAELQSAPDKVRRVRLQAGTVTLKSLDREGVKVESGGTLRAVAWPDVPPEDLLPLLVPAKPDAVQREGMAVLAAEQGQPDRLCEVLAPLYEKGAATPALDALVARLLDGRPEAPPGGYRLLKGRLLDATAFEAAKEDERLDALAARAADLVARLGKDPAIRKIDRMRELRDELDRRRGTALVAIFNEKHYPYPATKDRPPYTLVQAEIDRRVAAVRELWEGDESFKITRTGPTGRMADEVEAALAELEAKGRRQPALRAALAQVAPYLTGETIRLRDFWRDEAERKLMDYNRWVMQVYNPAHVQVARAQEAEQVAVTNAYRIMLGFTVGVRPGDAAYEAIDETSVAKILDQAEIVPGSIVALRAVRIDDRLVTAARLHSQDMERRGFFAHEAPPNPATGEPRTSPFDRMRKAGYEGYGASENICAGAGDPTAAHVMWCHSSGHHRNILSSWTDMGTGVSGTRWTQNFGTGGSRPAVIEPMPGDKGAGR